MIWLTGQSVTEGDMVTLLEALQTRSVPLQRLTRKDPDLTTIVLSDQGRSDEDIFSLLNALQSNANNVTHLYLHGNNITDESGVALAKYLATNSTVTDLSLSDNHLSDVTAKALALAFETNTVLERLFLDCNDIDPQTCDAVFIRALQKNPARPLNSVWEFYALGVNEFQRLRRSAQH